VDTANSASTGLNAQVFGYRSDRPFAEMPKIAVDVSASGYTVSDRKEALPAQEVTVTRNAGSVEVRIPLALLGDPEKLHLNAAIQPAQGPLDPMPWVAIALPTW
jgi:hypothetical protein